MHSYTQCLYFQDCNEFIAGNAIRSHSRFAALSETAVMGVVCRHENPVCFINLFHGERYLQQYACQVKPMHKCVHSIFQEQLRAMFPNHTLQIMYDIACVLEKHLNVSHAVLYACVYASVKYIGKQKR